MANKFEKDVQKKLEALQFEPSPSVWQQVEKRITQRKRRRVFFLLIPLLILLVLIAFHQFTKNEGEPFVSKQQKGSGTANALAEEKVPTKKAAESRGGKHETKPLNSVPSKDQPKTHLAKQNDEEHEKFSLQEKAPILATGKLNRNKQGNLPDSPTQTIPTALPESVIHPVSRFPLHSEEIRRSQQNHSPIQKEADVPKATAEDGNKTGNNAEIYAHPSSSRGNGKELKSRWTVGLSLTPGIVSMSKNLRLFSGSPSYDYANNPGTGSGLPPYVTSPTPKINNGFGFSVAVNASKPLSAKTIFTAGLEYQYVSLHQQMLVPGIIENNGNPDARFLNQNHYLTIPAGFRFENHPGKRRLTLEVGTGVSGLLHARTWQVNNPGEEDGSALHRLQVRATSGLYLDVLNRNAYTLMVGPYYRYHLNQAAKKGPLAGKHLHFAGVKMEIQLKKK